MRGGAHRRSLAGPRPGPQHRRPEGPDRRLPGRRGGRLGDDRRAWRARGRPLHGLRAGQRRGRGPPGDRVAAGRRGPRADGWGRPRSWSAPPSMPVRRRGECSTSPAPRPPRPPTSTPPPRWSTPRRSMSSAAWSDDDIPLNAGCLKPLRIIVPDGSMLNPTPARGRGRRQCRDQPAHRRRPVPGPGRHGPFAGHDEQPHLRRRRAAVLRDHLRRGGRDGPGRRAPAPSTPT